MVEETRVGFPAVELGLVGNAELVLRGWWMVVKELASACAPDDDTCMAVPRGEHSCTSGVEVKCGRVTAPGQRVPHRWSLRRPTLASRPTAG
jgi:hypothetical protein